MGGLIQEVPTEYYWNRDDMYNKPQKEKYRVRRHYCS